MKTLEVKTAKRTIHFVTGKTRIKKTKKVGDILNKLGFNKIGTGKSYLSVSHDNFLYK